MKVPVPDLIVHAFNDVHNFLTDFGAEEERPGFSALAGHHARSRRENPRAPHLFLGAGDDHAGGAPLDHFWTDSAERDPAYRIYEAAGVHALTLGNHDFDLGIDHLAAKLAFPRLLRVVVSNVPEHSPLARFSEAALEFSFGGIRIGIIGLVSSRNCLSLAEGLSLTDPVETAARRVRELEQRCDVIIVLSHLGLYAGPPPDSLPTDRDLLAGLQSAKPLLICGAHSHEVLPPLGETATGRIAYLQAGAYGRQVGVARLDRSAGVFQVSVDPVEPACTVDSAHEVRAEERSATLRVRQAAAVWPDMHFEHPDLAAEEVGVDCYRGESAHFNLVLDRLARAEQPGKQPGVATLAGICARTLGKGRLFGKVGLPEWYRTFHFPDRLAWIELPWRSLPDLLQANAQRLLDRPGFREDRGFLHFDGRLRYEVVFESDRLRVGQIRYSGEPFRRDAYESLYLLSTTLFTCRLGGFDAVLAEAGIGADEHRPGPWGKPLRDRMAEIFSRGAPAPAEEALTDGRVQVLMSLDRLDQTEPAERI